MVIYIYADKASIIYTTFGLDTAAKMLEENSINNTIKYWC